MRPFRVFCFLLLGSLLSSVCLHADTPAPMASSASDPNVHIFFKSYQKTPDGYVFQLYLMDLPPNQQPGPKKIGERIGWKDFVVGAFSLNIFKISSGNNPPTRVDASTLELIDQTAHRKVVLTYHGAVP